MIKLKVCHHPTIDARCYTLERASAREEKRETIHIRRLKTLDIEDCFLGDNYEESSRRVIHEDPEGIDCSTCKRGGAC